MPAASPSPLTPSLVTSRTKVPSFISVRTPTREASACLWALRIASASTDWASGSRAAGMGLRLAGFEALQAGGLLEFGAREGDRWQVRLVVPYEES